MKPIQIHLAWLRAARHRKRGKPHDRADDMGGREHLGRHQFGQRGGAGVAAAGMGWCRGRSRNSRELTRVYSTSTCKTIQFS